MSHDPSTGDPTPRARANQFLGHLVGAITDALVVLFPDARIRITNRVTCDMLGYTEPELAGQPFDILLPEGRAEQILAEAIDEGMVQAIETTFSAKDGRLIPVRLSGSVFFESSGDLGGWLCVAQDLSQGHALQAAERTLVRYNAFLTLLQRVAVAANEARTLEDALQIAVDEVCVHTGWPLGHVYLLAPDGSGELVPTGLWHLSEPQRYEAFRMATAETRYGEEGGLPGRVLRTAQPVWMTGDSGGPRAQVARQVGIRFGVGFPILVGSEVAGSLEFFSEREMEADPELLDVMTQLGTQLGRVVERSRAEVAMIQSREDYRGLFENAHDAIMIFNPANEVVLEVNARACEIYGFDRDSFIGLALPGISQDPQAARRKIEETLECGSSLYFETVHYRKDGSAMYLEVNASTVEYGGRPAILSINRDVTQRKRAEYALRESEERYALAASAANDGLWDWNLRTSLVYYSPRWKSILGLSDDEVDQTTEAWFSRVHPEDAVRLQWELVHHLEGATDHFESEHRLITSKEEYRWVLCRGLAVRDPSGRAYRIAGSMSDITERKRVEEQLVHDALHDGLTNLPSRILFLERLERAMKRSKRHEEAQFAVLFLDLDEFKMVNDSLGHAAGDDLLIEIGRRIDTSLRSTDTVARMGGDEFAILIEDIGGVEDGIRVAENIHGQLKQPFELVGRDVFASGSIGIALSHTGYDNPEEVLRDADTAMYRAKALGRSRHAVFDKQMHETAVSLLELETALRKAVESEELTLHYQPIVSLSSGKLTGFEALVRWPRTNGELVSPQEFIPLAEGTGLIVPLGRWVIGEACRAASQWRDQFEDGEFSINVNISAKQLWRPAFIDELQHELDICGLEPQHLKLEITESLLMENADAARDLLNTVRDLGVRLCIDDFGTGYSSLSYLQQLPIDTLKIDRSFVKGIANGSGELEIVRTIISLAHSLGLDLVAEGVETTEQLEQLRSMGCESGQGYLFSVPLDHTDSEKLIAAGTAW